MFGWRPDLFFSPVVNWCILSCLCFGCLCIGFSLQDLFNGLTRGKSNSLFDLHSVITTGLFYGFLFLREMFVQSWISIFYCDLHSLPFPGQIFLDIDGHFIFYRGPLTHKFVNTEILFTQLLILKFFFL